MPFLIEMAIYFRKLTKTMVSLIYLKYGDEYHLSRVGQISGSLKIQ